MPYGWKRGVSFPVGVISLGATLAVLVGWLADSVWIGDWTFYVPPVALAVWLVPWFGSVRVQAAISTEEGWRSGLPFELSPYPEVLRWRSFRSAKFCVSFIDEAPTKEWLLDVLNAGSYEVRNRDALKGEPEAAHHFEVTNRSAQKWQNQRRWLRRWLHWAMDEALLEVHRRYAIRALSFDPSQAGKWH